MFIYFWVFGRFDLKKGEVLMSVIGGCDVSISVCVNPFSQ